VRAERLHWSAAVSGFAAVADEAIARSADIARVTRRGARSA
jgi:hypothetical protein